MIEHPALSLTKGLGPGLAGREPAELIGTSLFDAERDFPQLSLSESALSHNIDEMMAYVNSRGVLLAPHGKTAMSPALAHRQLDAGAWAITAATPFQLRVYRSAGIPRLLLANQIVEPAAIAWLRDELARDPRFECLVYADSAAGLELLAGPAQGRPIDVLLEVGHAGGRTGTRGNDALRRLAAQAADTPGLRVVGLAAYEGTLGGETDDESAERVVAFARSLAETAAALEAERLLPPQGIVSIGGSAYFDSAIDGIIAGGVAPERIVLRSGAYVTHDEGLYARTTPRARGTADAPTLRPAISVWAPVLSIPEPGRIFALAGRRDVGFDQDLPVVRSVRGRDGSAARSFSATVTKLADQHAFIEFDPDAADPADTPKVGDLIELGISHPCTTLDRWGLVPLVDDEHHVRDLIRMYFT